MNIDRKNKLLYYIEVFFRRILPSGNYAEKVKFLEKKLSSDQKKSAQKRIDYYCKINFENHLKKSDKKIKTLLKAETPKAYYYDAYEYARFFNKNLPIDYVFGDVVHVPDVPSIVKSRPISDENQNSVLLNLDKTRHFVWVKNDKDFLLKKTILIGRGAVFQQHRFDFYEKYFNHPLCDLGQVNKIGGNSKWIKPKISIKKHLDYKFILSLEGNDVATNLKWIMSSNSIAVMPKPKYETWFMEGTLEGGKHFIEIKPDYSDLEEQLSFYIANPEKCFEIIKNAHQFCEQFFIKDVEDYCSLKTLEKYLII